MVGCSQGLIVGRWPTEPGMFTIQQTLATILPRLSLSVQAAVTNDIDGVTLISHGSGSWEVQDRGAG